MPSLPLPRAAATRRAIVAALAACPLVGAGLLPATDEATAKKRRARPEHNVRGKKAIMCLGGVTTRVPKHKRRKFLKRGATRGACSVCDCANGFLCCQNACVAATWVNQTTFGDGVGSGPSQFAGPYRVTISSDIRAAFIADPNNNRISIWTRPDTSSIAWSNQTTFGTLGSGYEQLQGPADVAVAPDTLTAWVADAGNNRISVWTRPSASSTAWSEQTTFGAPGSNNDEFAQPNGVAVSADTLTVWIADYLNNRISIWTRPNAGSTVWSNLTTFGSGPGSGANEFSDPLSVTVSPDTLTAWIADYANSRISVWTRPSSGSTAWSNQTTFGTAGSGPENLATPSDVAIATDSLTVWIPEVVNNRISIWTRPSATSAAWSNQTTFGATGPGSNQFNGPTGIAVTPDGSTVWIAEFTNNRISVWSAACPA